MHPSNAPMTQWKHHIILYLTISCSIKPMYWPWFGDEASCPGNPATHPVSKWEALRISIYPQTWPKKTMWWISMYIITQWIMWLYIHTINALYGGRVPFDTVYINWCWRRMSVHQDAACRCTRTPHTGVPGRRMPVYQDAAYRCTRTPHAGVPGRRMPVYQDWESPGQNIRIHVIFITTQKNMFIPWPLWPML